MKKVKKKKMSWEDWKLREFFFIYSHGFQAQNYLVN